MIYCFDTSALNRLHDDPERKSIARGIVVTNRIYISGLNIIEACATGDAKRRQSLIGLLKELSGNYRPLAIPNELLQTLAVAYAKRDTKPVITIDERQNGIWIALNAPTEIGDEERQEVLTWKVQLEESFRDAHRTARDAFQELFTSGRSPRPRTVSALIRHYVQNEDFLYEVVSPIYLRSTGKELPRNELRQFLVDVPSWQQYFLGWAHSVYSRTIRETKYGVKTNAGTIDLWCAVYLCFCDVFVTDDQAQRRALRILNVFNRRRTRVISYDTLRMRLLIG